MTTYSTLWNPSCTTDTQMRACLQAYSDALTTVGVVKTSDTGQIDIASAALPATVAANTPTNIGYEVRKLESPGKPTLYLRVQYQVVATLANTPSTYRLTINTSAGLSTDGAGNFNSASFPQPICSYGGVTTGPGTSTSQTVMRPLHVASDGQNYLTVVNDPAMLAQPGTGFGYLSFAVERSIAALTGEYDGEAFVSFCPYTTITSASCMVLNAITGASATSTSVGYQTPGNLWSSSGSLTQATIMPVTVCVPTPKGPALATLLAFSAEVTYGGQYQINMYGRLVTYIAASRVYQATQVNGIPTANVASLLRFD